MSSFFTIKYLRCNQILHYSGYITQSFKKYFNYSSWLLLNLLITSNVLATVSLPFAFDLISREGCDWPSRNWLWKNWCLRSAHPPVTAGLSPEASHSGPHSDQGAGISDIWAVWGPWLQHWCQVWYVSIDGSDCCAFVSGTYLFFFLSLAVIVGGIDMMSQSLVLAKKPHIVIGNRTVIIVLY